MRFILGLGLLFLAVPATVSACEGDCIIGITNAYIGNYSQPVTAIMDNLATQIAKIMPNNPSHAQAFSYLKPLIQAYNKDAYNGMETSIFPSYFHGKCLVNGVEPQGCPDPDCSVVCGTPGSLVHFFPTLRLIAYNATSHMLKNLTNTNSAAYKQFEQAVMQDVNSRKRRRSSRVFPRVPEPSSSSSVKKPSKAKSQPSKNSASTAQTNSVTSNQAKTPVGKAPVNPPQTPASNAAAPPASQSSATSGGNMFIPVLWKRAEDVKAELKNIMAQMDEMLLQYCGGDATDDTNGLPNCSWESQMKQYILSFP